MYIVKRFFLNKKFKLIDEPQILFMGQAQLDSLAERTRGTKTKLGSPKLTGCN